MTSCAGYGTWLRVGRRRTSCSTTFPGWQTQSASSPCSPTEVREPRAADAELGNLAGRVPRQGLSLADLADLEVVLGLRLGVLVCPLLLDRLARLLGHVLSR